MLACTTGPTSVRATFFKSIKMTINQEKKETLEEFMDRLEQEVDPIIVEDKKAFEELESKIEEYAVKKGEQIDEMSQKKDIGIFGWVLAASICTIVATGFIFTAIVVTIVTSFCSTMSWLKSTTMRLFSR